jgi:hypothetical protein
MPRIVDGVSHKWLQSNFKHLNKAFILLSKITQGFFSSQLIAAHTWTLTGCVGLTDMLHKVSNTLHLLYLGLTLACCRMLSTTKSPMCFQLNTSLISPNHIFQLLIHHLIITLKTPFLPLNLVWFPDELAICTTPKCPP